MDSDRALPVEISMVDDFLHAIENGECVALPRIAEELRSIRAALATALSTQVSASAAREELRLLLTRDADLSTEARRVVARGAIRFLNSEVEHYSRLAAQRELSADEKQFGRESLLPVVDALRSLFGRKRGHH